MDKQAIITRLCNAFADRMAKIDILVRQPRHHSELIRNTSWVDLCNGKIPRITVLEETKLKHKEMYNLLLSVITENEEMIFKE